MTTHPPHLTSTLTLAQVLTRLKVFVIIPLVWPQDDRWGVVRVLCILYFYSNVDCQIYFLPQSSSSSPKEEKCSEFCSNRLVFKRTVSIIFLSWLPRRRINSNIEMAIYKYICVCTWRSCIFMQTALDWQWIGFTRNPTEHITIVVELENCDLLSGEGVAAKKTSSRQNGKGHHIKINKWGTANRTTYVSQKLLRSQATLVTC